MYNTHNKMFQPTKDNKEVRDELWIDGKFTVPQHSPWPEWAYGYRLGKVATILRRSKKAGVNDSIGCIGKNRIRMETQTL